MIEVADLGNIKCLRDHKTLFSNVTVIVQGLLDRIVFLSKRKCTCNNINNLVICKN